MKPKMANLLFSMVFFLAACSGRDSVGPAPPAQGPTEVQGSVSGVFAKAESPFLVLDDIVVDSARTLTIEAGVELIFSDGARLDVRGQLLAAGARNEPILFHAANQNWNGIHMIHATGKSLLQFCIIEEVELLTTDHSGHGAVEINNSSADIFNCIFRDNAADWGGGLSVLDSARVRVYNSIFRDNQCVVFGGAVLLTESDAEIINNTFFSNRVTNVGGGLVLINPQVSDIQNNIFYQNSGVQGDDRIYFSSGDSGDVNIDWNFVDPNSDPRFISGNDLHLLFNSPAINAGNPDPAFNDADGTRNDQGAYGGPGGNW